MLYRGHTRLLGALEPRLYWVLLAEWMMLKAFLPKKRRSQPRNGRRRRNAKKNSFARARKPFVVQLFLGFLCAFFFYSFLYFQKEAGTWKNFLLTLGFGYLRNLLLELSKMAFILGHILGKNRLDVIFFLDLRAFLKRCKEEFNQFSNLKSRRYWGSGVLKLLLAHPSRSKRYF